MKIFISFIFTYLLVLAIYEIFLIVPIKRGDKKEKRELVEIRFLVSKYGLNMKKVNYKQLVQVVALTSSFDISVVVTVAFVLNNWIIQILVMIVLTLLLFIISYYLVYCFYKKKGMIKNV